MFNTALVNEALHDAHDYGFEVTSSAFNWAALKEKRDAYVKRLNGIYNTNMAKDNITYVKVSEIVILQRLYFLPRFMIMVIISLTYLCAFLRLLHLVCEFVITVFVSFQISPYYIGSVLSWQEEIVCS